MSVILKELRVDGWANDTLHLELLLTIISLESDFYKPKQIIVFQCKYIMTKYKMHI